VTRLGQLTPANWSAIAMSPGHRRPDQTAQRAAYRCFHVARAEGPTLTRSRLAVGSRAWCGSGQTGREAPRNRLTWDVSKSPPSPVAPSVGCRARPCPGGRRNGEAPRRPSRRACGWIGLETLWPKAAGVEPNHEGAVAGVRRAVSRGTDGVSCSACRPALPVRGVDHYFNGPLGHREWRPRDVLPRPPGRGRLRSSGRLLAATE
jgi:hypothetical protein